MKQQEPEAQVVSYTFGYFSVFAFMFPVARWLVIWRFRKWLLATVGAKEHRRVDLVGHSFGTLVAVKALAGIPHPRRPRIHTLILAGSVLRSRFNWEKLQRDGSVRRVVNECGIRDGILALSQLFVLGTGMAGRVGFYGGTDDRLRNRFYRFGHSAYFQRRRRLTGGVHRTLPYNRFMRLCWVPLLTGDGPVPDFDKRKPSSASGAATFLLNNFEPVKLLLWFLLLATPLFFFWRWHIENQVEKTISLWQEARQAREAGEAHLAAHLAAAALAVSPQRQLDREILADLDGEVHRGSLVHVLPHQPEPYESRLSIYRDFLATWSGRELQIRSAATGEPQGAALFLEEEIAGAKFSIQQEEIAVWGSSSLSVWNVEDGTLIAGPLRHSGIENARFSRDSTRVVSRSPELLRLWSVPDGELLGTFDVDDYAQVSGVWLADAYPLDDGSLYAVACVDFQTDCHVGYLTLEEGRLVEDKSREHLEWSVTGAAVDPWHDTFVVWNQQRVLLGDLLDEEETLSFDLPWTARDARLVDDGVVLLWNDESLYWSDDAGYDEEDSHLLDIEIAGADASDHSFLVWEPDDRTFVFDANAQRFGPPLVLSGLRRAEIADEVGDGYGAYHNRVLTHGEGETRIWELPDDHWSTAEEPVAGSALRSRDGASVLVQRRQGGRFRVWDPVSGEPQTAWMAFEGSISGFDFDCESHQLVAWSSQEVGLWDVESGEARYVAEPGFEPILPRLCPDGAVRMVNRDNSLVAVSPAGEVELELAAAEGVPRGYLIGDCSRLVRLSRETVEILDLATGERSELDYGYHQGVTWSHDNSRLVARAPDGRWQLLDLLAGRAVGEAIAEDGNYFDAPFSHRGDRFLTITGSKIALWNALDGSPVLEPMRVDGNTVAAFTEKGDWWYLVGISEVEVRSAADGVLVGPPLASPCPVEGVAFSADRRLAATWCRGSEVRLWNPRTGEQVGPAVEHTGPVTGVRLSPTGDRFATWGGYRIVVWDRERMQSIGRPLSGQDPEDPVFLGSTGFLAGSSLWRLGGDGDIDPSLALLRAGALSGTRFHAGRRELVPLRLDELQEVRRRYLDEARSHAEVCEHPWQNLYLRLFHDDPEERVRRRMERDDLP